MFELKNIVLFAVVFIFGCASEQDLFDAAAAGDLDEVRSLLEAGIDKNARDHDGITALHLAAKFGRSDVVRFLVESGVDANVRDRLKMTPLHEAAGAGQLETCRLLLEKGADINRKDAYLSTPLMRICFNDVYPEVGKLLLNNGADVHIRNISGNTALHTAAQYQNVEIAKLLIDYGADLAARNKKEQTPLDRAGKDFAEFLIQYSKTK